MNAHSPVTVTEDLRRIAFSISVNADQPLSLSAANASGDITLATDPDLPAGTVHLVAVRADGQLMDEDTEWPVSVKVEDNSISIHPEWQIAAGLGGIARRVRDQFQHGFKADDWNITRLKLGPERDLNFTISLPPGLGDGTRIKLRTASGAVSVRDVDGQVSVATASGTIEAEDISGTAAFHTASGDVNVRSIDESLEINSASGDVSIAGGDMWLASRSASGDISIEGSRLRNARITTVSGDISVASPLDNAAPYGMETVSGDISVDLVLPASGATLGFGTLSGSAHVGSGWSRLKKREWTAGEADADRRVAIKTVSGDLSATCRIDSSLEARAMPLPVRSSDDGMDDFREEMARFGREMKRFGEEMKVEFGGVPPIPPTPPAPPAPPVPPASWDEASAAAYEARMEAYEDQMQRYEEEIERHEQAVEEAAERAAHDSGHREHRVAEHHQRIAEHHQRRIERDQRTAERDQRRAEADQRRAERDQRRAEHEQRRAEHQAERERAREVRRAERDRRREDRHHPSPDPSAPLFTAGPSGRPYRSQPDVAQPTEPVAPPTPWQEEPTVTTTNDDTVMNVPAAERTEPIAPAGAPAGATAGATAGAPADFPAGAPAATTSAFVTDAAQPGRLDRLQILELLERGEIDIDEAMKRLESAT